jgi:hypothetical protein
MLLTIRFISFLILVQASDIQKLKLRVLDKDNMAKAKSIVTAPL